MKDQEIIAQNERLIEALSYKDAEILRLYEKNQQLKELVQYLLNELSETKDIAQERFKNILYKLS